MISQKIKTGKEKYHNIRLRKDVPCISSWSKYQKRGIREGKVIKRFRIKEIVDSHIHINISKFKVTMYQFA